MTIREAGSQVKNLRATGLPTVARFVGWSNQWMWMIGVSIEMARQ